MSEATDLASRTELAERAVSLIDAELATPVEQRPNRTTDDALANLKSLVLSIERALDGGDTGKARRPIEHLSYFATDELDYETELAAAVAAYLQAVDPES
jgi:hypothetical protein